MSQKHPRILDPKRAALIVVDIQDRFKDVISGFEEMAAASIRLVSTFRALELPIIVTEQYPKGLGRTIPALGEALGGTAPPYEKTCFSSCGSDAVSSRLEELGTEHAVVCGIEVHVCVSQTVHDLIQRGILVHLAVDAVASRKALDREVALRKMERSGAVLTTAEATAFELLGDANKSTLRLHKASALLECTPTP